MNINMNTKLQQQQNNIRAYGPMATTIIIIIIIINIMHTCVYSMIVIAAFCKLNLVQGVCFFNMSYLRICYYLFMLARNNYKYIFQPDRYNDLLCCLQLI